MQMFVVGSQEIETTLFSMFLELMALPTDGHLIIFTSKQKNPSETCVTSWFPIVFDSVKTTLSPNVLFSGRHKRST